MMMKDSYQSICFDWLACVFVDNQNNSDVNILRNLRHIICEILFSIFSLKLYTNTVVLNCAYKHFMKMVYSVVTLEKSDVYQEEFTVVVPDSYIQSHADKLLVFYPNPPFQEDDFGLIKSFVEQSLSPPPDFYLHPCHLNYQTCMYNEALALIHAMDTKVN